MFYIIYKITNKLNGKIYIGKHQTKDLNDGYMGSGKLITRAIQKYGFENFEKEILFIFKTETEMNAKEAELVTHEFVNEETNYNLCPGGRGGFGYLNANGLNNAGKDWDTISLKKSKKLKGVSRPEISERNKKQYAEGTRIVTGAFSKEGTDEMRKRALTPEANKKRSETMRLYKGEKNSQYKTYWITNGKDNKKIKKSETMLEGWFVGRTYPPTLQKLEMCIECRLKEKDIDDLYWWNVYIESKLPVSTFVKEKYPYNSASFYNMKKRLKQNKGLL